MAEQAQDAAQEEDQDLDLLQDALLDAPVQSPQNRTPPLRSPPLPPISQRRGSNQNAPSYFRIC